ncbi:MAG TPA: hypothetical protein P5567_07860 [Kiritimatiellia bacterium]|nr:hypothetical protein [Kiritimatiellia bacterium]HRZ12354.1 hypothetical protein [Kiritimatiellia bacterium]HSA17888.1 hypothetical protein [Kiritimatiellia bacterium]
MPSTLVHLGAQGIVSKAVFRKADLKWVFLGLVIPDVPWILQRAIRVLPFTPNPYDLKLYGVVQSSLAFCLLLGAALALLSSSFWKTWAALAFNSLLHLLLDAAEQKGGNGVFLFAPASWRMTDWDLLPAEGWAVTLLTALGVAVGLWGLYQQVRAPAGPIPPLRSRLLLAAAAGLAAYGLLPLAFIEGPLEADAFSIRTLKDVERRPGRAAAFDRAVFLPEDGGRLRLFSGEVLRVEGISLDRQALVTAGGVFLAPDRFRADRWVAHTPRYRDAATGLGLAFGAAMWLHAGIRRMRRSWKP